MSLRDAAVEHRPENEHSGSETPGGRHPRSFVSGLPDVEDRDGRRPADSSRASRGPQLHAALATPRNPACISAEEAFAQLGIDRTTGYRAIREGTFPVPVIRIGRLIRVPTAAFRRLLALDPDVDPGLAGYVEKDAPAAGPGSEDSGPGSTRWRIGRTGPAGDSV